MLIRERKAEEFRFIIHKHHSRLVTRGVHFDDIAHLHMARCIDADLASGKFRTEWYGCVGQSFGIRRARLFAIRSALSHIGLLPESWQNGLKCEERITEADQP